MSFILVLAGTLHIGSAMLLFALHFFVLVIFRSANTAIDPQFAKKIHWGILGGLAVEAASGFLWFWWVAVQMSEHSPWSMLPWADLRAVLCETQFGLVWMIRAVIGMALLFVGTRPKWPALAISCILLTTLAFAGHAEAGIHYRALHLMTDSVHLLAGAIWPMGLIPLVILLWQKEGCSIEVLRRFSNISMVTVLILTFTGLANSFLMISSWEGLVVSSYGKLLLGKVFLVGTMILMGAINRLYWIPKMQDTPEVAKNLRLTIVMETGLMFFVMVIVGIMGMTPPPS